MLQKRMLGVFGFGGHGEANIRPVVVNCASIDSLVMMGTSMSVFRGGRHVKASLARLVARRTRHRRRQALFLPLTIPWLLLRALLKGPLYCRYVFWISQQKFMNTSH